MNANRLSAEGGFISNSLRHRANVASNQNFKTKYPELHELKVKFRKESLSVHKSFHHRFLLNQKPKTFTEREMTPDGNGLGPLQQCF